MIVVFVIDTSPSMAAPSNGAKGISKLDVAKMSVENLARSLDKRVMDHNRSVLLALSQPGPTANVGKFEQFDEFLLLSSSLQPDKIPQSPGEDANVPSLASIAAAAEAHASCGAGGRLLVGSVEDNRGLVGMMDSSANAPSVVPHPPDRSDFEHELKRLRAAKLPSDAKAGKNFPEWAGGAQGLNAALSHGLGLLSRYRLTRGRNVEHFGMGRLPWTEHQMAKTMSKGDDANSASKYDSPLQPACLILLTDGECFRLPPEEGGGSLGLKFGNIPLREFYKEPFRWDQRIFILHVADEYQPPLHKSLRALCEVTGGAHQSCISASVPSLSRILLNVAPPKPKLHSIRDPLRLPSMSTPVQDDDTNGGDVNMNSVFVNGGPICGFQCLEGGEGQLHRAMILFAGACEQQRWILTSSDQKETIFIHSPIWCIPESHWPSKKLDTLPPRPSQPLLHYSRNFQAVGSPVFDPYSVMKALHHLDQLQVSIRQLLVDAGDNPPPIANRMLQRDVYICDWLGGGSNDQSNATGAPRTIAGREHFPIGVRGAGRPALSGEGDNILNIGILHVPHNWVTLTDIADSAISADRLPTFTLLPPDAHLLIPLLIRVAEMELRILKKAESKDPAGGAKKKINSSILARSIHLDDNWTSEFRAYLFRLPPYYLPAIRRVLRPMLPPNVLSLLNVEASEALPLLCFSPTCYKKILDGEKAAQNRNDWLRNVEQNLNPSSIARKSLQDVDFGYGQYDPRMSEHQYLNAIRNLPPPWKNGVVEEESKDENDSWSPISLLPSSCLLAYYESRRRWIFGGTGLVTRGLHVDGVDNDGCNAHHYDMNCKVEDMPLIALAGCGAHTTNQTSISQMGDFKGRLNFAPSTFVDYSGSTVGSAITTGSDGSPNYSVDDDVLPPNFFDPASGEFIDSPQQRMRARASINFGNPFQDKRGASFVPEKFSSQRPPLHGGENGPCTPPGSPPHDAYDSHSPIEGEGEAAFTGRSPSPPRSPRKLLDSNLLSLKQKKAAPPGPPIRAGEEKRRKTSPLDEDGMKDQPQKSATPPPPISRPPPPPRRQSHAKPGPAAPPPPPPSKPVQAQKQTPQKLGIPKPAPPKRQSSKEASPQTADQVSRGIGWQSLPPNTSSGHSKQPQQQQQDLTMQLQNPGEKPKIKLPEGWICSWSKSQKRWYFFDTRTNKSVWDPEHIKMSH